MKNLFIIHTLLFYFFFASSYTFHLIYNKNHSTITLFTYNSSQLILQIDYTSTQLHLPPNLKKQDFLFFNRQITNKISLHLYKNEKDKNLIKNNLFFDFLQHQKQFQTNKIIKISGKVGLKYQNNLFFSLIKHSNHQEYIRLDLDKETNSMEIVFDTCFNPIKFPLRMRIEGLKEKDVYITHLSNNFIPDKQFFSQVVGKQSDPFYISKKQSQNFKIKLSINQKVQDINLKEILTQVCHKDSVSHDYQCSLSNFKNLQQQKSNFEGLLMYYDLSICENGIQINSPNIQPQQTYYFLHFTLLILTMLCGVVHLNEDLVIKMIKKLLAKKKKH